MLSSPVLAIQPPYKDVWLPSPFQLPLAYSEAVAIESAYKAVAMKNKLAYV